MDERSQTTVSRAGSFSAASGMSDHLDTRTAATELAGELHEALEGAADLIVLFGSYHHRNGLAAASESLRNAFAQTRIIGTTAESVLANEVEREALPGLAAIALRIPRVGVHTFHLEPGGEVLREDAPERTRELIGWRADTRAIFLLADPFSTPAPQIIRLLETCGDDDILPVGGGLASGASQPGQNMLIHDEASITHGFVGVTLSGAIDVDFVVSQGCRPIGPVMVVTDADANVIRSLGGRPAMQVIQEVAESLSEREKSLLTKGLLIGAVIDEYRERFGRGDFLIRNVMGFDQKTGAMAVAEAIPVGRTIQLHVRDAATASEDLDLLLDGQQLRPDPFAALVFTCNGRGTRLFDGAHHDAAAIHGRLHEPALAGFFAAGEIGPIGGQSFVHGHTVSAGILRDPAAT